MFIFSLLIQLPWGTTSTKIVTLDSAEAADTTYFASDFSTPEELIAYRENLNREIVNEGAVLLKNNGALPLGSSVNVTMFGIGGVSPVYRGSSGGGVIKNPAQIVPLTDAFAQAGITTNPTVHDWYVSTGIPETCMIPITGRDGSTTINGPWDSEANHVATRANGVTEADASGAFTGWRDSYASYQDAAIVMLCRQEGEGADLPEGSLAVSPEEQALIEEAKANFDKVVVVVNSSAAMEIDALAENGGIDAILWVSELGTHGAFGLADVLTGLVNPSGHLPDTFAADSTSSPAYQNSGNFVFANAEAAGQDNFGSFYTVNAEGIYMGYKYYETRYEDCVLGRGNAASDVGTFASTGNWNYGDEVTYGFGYGLSYTTFEQTLDSLSVDQKGQTVTLKATVKNTGSVAAKGKTTADGMDDDGNPDLAKTWTCSSLDKTSFATGSTATNYALITLRGADYDDPLWEELLDQVTLEEMASLITDACGHTNPVMSVSYQGSLDKDGPIGYDATFTTDTALPYHIDGSASGYVKNYNFTTQCTEPTLAASFNLELAKERGNMNGEDSLWSGYTELWAPGINLHRTPYSGRNYEYYSEDAMLSNLMSVQVAAATQAKGAVAGVKHFAGNDQETNRNGVATFYNEQALRELQLRAFEGAFRPDEGGVTGTMTSFSRIGLKQAAYCDELLTNVLRGEWGFAGYTITDFAFSNLMYPYASLTAGTDAFDNMISDFSAINANSLAGDAKLLSAARQATHRILYTYVNSNAMNGVAANTKVVKVTPPWKMAIQGVEIASGVLTVICAGLYVVSVVNRKKEAV